MIETNEKYDELFIKLNVDVNIEGTWYLAQSTFKFKLKKEVLPDSGCNCTEPYYQYFVTERADGCELENGIWFDDFFVVETREVLPQPKTRLRDEFRGDLFEKESHLHAHQRTKGEGMTDKDGYIKLDGV